MASTHTLEIVIVACVMVSATTFVVTFDTSMPSSATAHERDIEQKAWDLLHIWQESDYAAFDACRGADRLEELVIQGLRSDSNNWDRQIRKHFQPGTEASLLLDNGEAILPIHEKRMLVGSTEAVPIAFDHDYALPLNQLSNVDGTVALTIDTLQIRQSDLLTRPGEHLEIVATTNDGLIEGAAIAQAVVAVGEPAAGVGVHWGKVSSPSHLVDFGMTDSNLGDLYLTLTSPGGTLTAGMQASVRFPPLWTVDLIKNPAGAWSNLTEGSVESGLRLTFMLHENATGPLTARFRATPPDDPISQFSVLHASLSDGSVSDAPLVVKHPVSTERDLPRQLFTATTSPMRAGSPAFFGIVFANGGSATTVTQLDVRVPGGYDMFRHDGAGAGIFAEGEAITHGVSQGKWEWQDERHLRWTGNVSVASGDAKQWLFSWPIAEGPEARTDVERSWTTRPWSTLVFENGYEHTTSLASPTLAFLRHVVPPDDPTTEEVEGYPWFTRSANDSVVVPAYGTHTYTVRTHATGSHLQGIGSYEVVPQASDPVEVDSSLAKSGLTLSQRAVPLGSTLVATADFESLANELAANGATDIKLGFELFAPPSIRCAPVATWSKTAVTLPQSRALGMAFVDDAAGPGLLFSAAHKAYRHGFLDATDWESLLGFGVSATALAPSSATGSSVVFVGDSFGRVYRLDATTGTATWDDPARLGVGIARLMPSPDGARLLALSVAGDAFVLDAATGAREATHQAHLDADTHAVWTAGGTLHLLRGETLESFASNGDLLAASQAPGAFALAASDEGLLVASPGRVVSRSAAHDLLASVEGPADLLGYATGDVTGDGHPDLALVDGFATLWLYDGSTGALEWSRAVGGTRLELPPLTTWSGVPMVSNCKPGAYQEIECHAGDAGDTPLGTRTTGRAIVSAAPEGVAFSYSVEGAASIASVSPDGERRDATAPQGVASLVIGRDALGPAVAVANDHGAIQVFDSRMDTQRDTTGASTFVYRYEVPIRLPAGGFYGTHLLTATLDWTTSEGTTHQARLTEWFAALSSDGKPVPRPAYRATIATETPG